MPPSNLGIDTQISNDNSGGLSITPYGLESHLSMLIKERESTIDTIGLGSSLTHIYKSGEYTNFSYQNRQLDYNLQRLKIFFFFPIV
ncbi:MAG: hypothetical protein CM15mP83_2580 [Flavobacteriaceae bacterium]|nr:MAG: hypothetical protein CM15mP83_2580 [Flavobacteriaceae bacterium]